MSSWVEGWLLGIGVRTGGVSRRAGMPWGLVAECGSGEDEASLAALGRGFWRGGADRGFHEGMSCDSRFAIREEELLGGGACWIG